MRKIICQNQFLVVYLISFCFVVSHSLLAFRCRSDQSSALLRLKREFAIQKPFFGDASEPVNMVTWKENSDCCLWDGVTCNMSTGHVISLDLSQSGLQGPFPSNSSLFSLDQLEGLNLAFNNFNFSRIPTKFSQLSRLTHLNLSNSNFFGNIPSEFSLLMDLVSLDLSRNYLFSSLLDMKTLVQNMTNLTELHLDDVKFDSSVPESLVSLSSLTHLSLSRCNLGGVFPLDIFQLPHIQTIILSQNYDLIIFLPPFESGSFLRWLDLSFTNFSGEIPNSIGKLKSLNVLDLQYCELSGAIPSWVGNLNQLTFLDLSHNRFNRNLPVTLRNLSQLWYHDLSDNKFGGQFPSMLENLSQLTHLDLSSNHFKGSLPLTLDKNVPKLTFLKIGSNQFSGQIPSSTGNLTQLSYLDLSDNLFHGKFPVSLENLTQLRWLDLSENQFAGPIPSHIFRNSNSMIKLNLSGNSFIGVVPSSLFTIPSLKFLLLDDNQFTGPLNIKNISSSQLTLLSQNKNKLSGKIPRSISNFANLKGLLLQSNLVTGHFEFDMFLKLRFLDLSDNRLTGTLPKCFASSLSQVNIEGNNFYGNIPETCTDECSLERLILALNRLQGKLPQSLTKCRELKIIDLTENMLQDTFPFFLQALPKLAVLGLRSNKFHGPIWVPGQFWGFVDLRVFDLSRNNFSGDLSSEYFANWSAVTGATYFQEQREWKAEAAYYQHSTTFMEDFDGIMYRRNYLTVFRTIDLSDNRFHGKVPDCIGEISSLVVLNLSYNKFESLIPLSLMNVAWLEALDLSRNNLSGRIPEQFISLHFLGLLNLSYNQLMGPIPQGSQFDTFGSYSYVGNLKLCGLPLSRECENSETPVFHHRMEQESEDSFDWKSILWGYGYGLGIGFIAGLIGGHIIISKKLSWFVETYAAYIRSHIGKR